MWTRASRQIMLEPELKEHTRAKEDEQEVQLRLDDGAPRKFLVVYFLFLFEDTLPDSFNHFRYLRSQRVAMQMQAVCAFIVTAKSAYRRNWFGRVPCESKRQRQRQRCRMLLTTSTRHQHTWQRLGHPSQFPVVQSAFHTVLLYNNLSQFVNVA